MDSFYDMPRRAPAPTPVEKFLAAPAVPEVSLFCPPDGQGQMNYNAWKMQQVQTGHYTASSKVNISKNFNMNSMESSIILKKQVRFEGPISHPHPVVSSNMKMHKIGKENMDPSDTDHKNHRQPANTFEQIYMANIPNRQLDLSLVDLPKNNFNKKKVANLASRDITLSTVLVEDRNQENKCLSNDKSEATEDDIKKTDKLPKTYQEFLEKQKRVVENKKIGSDNSVTDLYNYKRSPMKIPSLVLEKKYDKYFTPNSEDPKIVDNIQPHITDNEPFFKEPAPRRNLPNSQDYDFNHKLYKTKDEPILSHCKCSHGEQKMCSDQKKNIINSENDQSGQIQISPPSSDEPTNKDLLKIIAQQNEQLLLLQKQVTMLLSREQSNAKSIMAPPNRPQVIGEKIMSSTQTEHFHQHVYTPSKKRGLSKFSIDMMTSFEVAIRPSQNNKNQFSKIQEITESESTSEPMEPSLRLEGPLSVPEDCPSPEPTVNIEMQGYDSSDEDGTPDIGATFYKNLMGQVNDILKRAQQKTKGNAMEGKRKSEKNDETMQRIKKATLKHLKNIGVTVDDDESSSNSFSPENSSYSPTEVSFAVKQLLMKYLPDEELAKLAQIKKPTNEPVREKNAVGCNVPPQFSMASIEYLKKYNIIPNTDNDSRPSQTAPQQKENRILDLTALKNQPKLL